MKLNLAEAASRRTALLALCCAVSVLTQFTTRAGQAAEEEFGAQFFKLCDLASAELSAGKRQPGFFIDSYAVRALCVAYDLTGKKSYLNACRAWSDEMVGFQEKMVPRGAYYMNYGRKPGETNGAWYVADSSSIAMGVLATAVRCEGAEKQRFLNSAKSFAALVMDNYVGAAGGIRNGLWPKFDGEWWCSSGIFGSLAFLLHDETGDERYLSVARGTLEWLNNLDLAKDQPYPLSEMGPTMVMYVLEAYSAGLPHLKPDSASHKAALRQISWALDWMAEQQRKPPAERQWPAPVKWGMKFGGLPFHQYVYSRSLAGGQKLTAAADREMQQLASVVFAKQPELSQLTVFMMMSYAERLCPGAVYRNSSGSRTAVGDGRQKKH